MQDNSALRKAVNQLHQEADGLAAVASLCYNDAVVQNLEHVNAAHFQSLLKGFASRLHSLALQFEQSTTAKPMTALDYKAFYKEARNGSKL